MSMMHRSPFGPFAGPASKPEPADPAHLELRGQIAKKSKRGFASMSPEKQREIAAQGGKAAHQQGKAHQWTSEEAREAGRKGGSKTAKNRRDYVPKTGE